MLLRMRDSVLAPLDHGVHLLDPTTVHVGPQKATDIQDLPAALNLPRMLISVCRILFAARNYTNGADACKPLHPFDNIPVRRVQGYLRSFFVGVAIDPARPLAFEDSGKPSQFQVIHSEKYSTLPANERREVSG